MKIKPHHLTMIVLIGIFALLYLSLDAEWSPYELTGDFVSVCVFLGSSILTLVGIFTSILTSNENDRRTEYSDIINNISTRIIEKKGLLLIEVYILIMNIH